MPVEAKRGRLGGESLLAAAFADARRRYVGELVWCVLTVACAASRIGTGAHERRVSVPPRRSTALSSALTNASISARVL